MGRREGLLSNTAIIQQGVGPQSTTKDSNSSDVIETDSEVQYKSQDRKAKSRCEGTR